MSVSRFGTPEYNWVKRLIDLWKYGAYLVASLGLVRGLSTIFLPDWYWRVGPP